MKIIELAERVDKLSLGYTDIREQFGICELSDALEERKALEQTPITEDWLEEHGWIFYTKGYCQRPDGKLAIVCITDESGWKIPGTKIHLYSLADLYDLYDFMSLCGIKID